MELNPCGASLFTAYRAVIYERRIGARLVPDWPALGGPARRRRSSCSSLAILLFKRLEPTFAKVL